MMCNNTFKVQGPKRTLRITALGPRASDRNVIPVEMKEEEALKFKYAKKEIDSKLKKTGLKMKAPMYWIGKSEVHFCSAIKLNSTHSTDCGIHRVNLPSYCDWPWHLKHSNYNLYCDCDEITKV